MFLHFYLSNPSVCHMFSQPPPEQGFIERKRVKLRKLYGPLESFSFVGLNVIDTFSYPFFVC